MRSFPASVESRLGRAKPKTFVVPVRFGLLLELYLCFAGFQHFLSFFHFEDFLHVGLELFEFVSKDLNDFLTNASPMTGVQCNGNAYLAV